MGRNLQRGAERFAGSSDVAEFELAEAEALPGAVVIGIDLERTLAVGDGFLEPAHLPEHGGPPVPCLGVARMFRRELIEKRQRLRVILSVGQLAGREHFVVRAVAFAGEPQMIEAAPGHFADGGLLGLERAEQLRLTPDF